MATPTGHVPADFDAGTSQEKRMAPQDEENDQPMMKYFKADPEDGTFVNQRQQGPLSSSLPSSAQLFYIKENVGLKWKDLARMLGFSEPVIEVFAHKHTDPRESCMEMLTSWCQEKGKNGTVDMLRDALVTAKLSNIADDLDLYQDKPKKGMHTSDNQRITEQDRQDKTGIRMGSLTESDVNWKERAEVAMAILQGKNISGWYEPNRLQQPIHAVLPPEQAASTSAHDAPAATTPKGPGSSSSTDYLRQGVPRFHSEVHGRHICIDNNGTIARSRDSFNNSVCFSEMPINVGEKTNMKIIDSRTFGESVRFGFTSVNPDSMSVEELPAQSYPTLAQQPGFWVKPLPGSLAHQGCVVSYSVGQSGDVTFAVDGEDKGLFFSGVDVSKPLWAVVDVHGSAVAVQFVDDQAVCEVSDKWIHEGDQVQLLEEDMDTLRDMQTGHGGFVSEMEKAVGEVGIVTRIDDDNEDMHVFFPCANKRWRFTPAALRKVRRPDIKSSAILAGDLVQITTDLERLKSVQKEQSLWKDDMERILGKIGRVGEVRKHGDLTVRVAGEEWELSNKVVQQTDSQGDMCIEGLHHWKSEFSKVCVKCGECTAVGAGCSMKDKPLRLAGSCCGCRKLDAGCADCGLCKSCAGEATDREKILDILSGFLEHHDEEGPHEHGLEKGDEVKVHVDRDTFQSLQEEHNLGWNEDMAMVIGTPGTITARFSGNDVLVRFRDGQRLVIFSGCLTKTASGAQGFMKGDLVQVIKDEEKLKELQKGHGGYNDRMQPCLGKTGCVKKVQKQSVQVDFAFTRSWWYNPAALTKVSSLTVAEQETTHQLKAGDCVKVAVDDETLSQNQHGHGGRIHELRKVMETAGVIGYIDIDGDAFVRFQLGLRTLINPASLEKVKPEYYEQEDKSELKVDELVKVDEDRTKIRRVMKGTATVDWDCAFYATAGKVGVVKSVHPSDNIICVHINTATFPLNPALVKRASLADMQKHYGQMLEGSDFARGDLVKIAVSLDELKSLQEGHGGFRADMEKVLNDAGPVCFIDFEGDVYVRFSHERLCFNPAALSKVIDTKDEFCVGDLVHIESDLERFKSLQTPQEHGGYVEEMKTSCGKIGRLMSIVNSEKIRVKVEGRSWIFNPGLLRRIEDTRQGTEHWKSATICTRGKHDWSMGRSLVCFICGECTDEGKLCFAQGRPNRTPGSVCGCGDGHAGCDDCGACRTCAGEDEEGLELLERGKLKEVIKKNIEKMLKEEAEKRLAVDDTKTVVAKHRQSGPEVDFEVRRKKMLPVLEKMSEAIELIRWSKDVSSVEQVAHNLHQHINLPAYQYNITDVERKQFGDHLVYIGAPQVLMEYGSLLSSQASQSDGKDGKLSSTCLRILYGIVQTHASSSAEFNLAVGRCGLLQMTVHELGRQYKMEESGIQVNQELVQDLVSILGNCARLPENWDYFRDLRAVYLLSKHLSNDDMALKLVTVNCLAHIVDAEDLDLIQLPPEDVDFFVKALTTAVGSDTHSYKVYETKAWTVTSLVRDMIALARHDGNKHEFVRKGIMEALIKLIESGNDMEKEYAMLCVQRFAMVDSIRETIASESRVGEVLRALLSEGPVYAVQAVARKTLKCLGREAVSS